VNSLELNEDNTIAFFVLVGMGAGYHVRVLHQALPSIPIHVWDFNNNYAEWIHSTGLLSWMEKYTGEVTYRVTESMREVRKGFLPLIQNPHSCLLIHPPSLEIMPGKLHELKQALEDYLLFRRTVRAQGHLLDKNYQFNLALGDPGITQWINGFNNHPAILVSAGPSLTKQFSLLQDVRKKSPFIIGSMGTALTPLLKAGIKPDFFMLSDPQDAIIEQINKFDFSDIPLFYLCTANAKAIAYYKGPRYIVWQKGFREAEIQAEKRGEPLIKTGGSVATCLLDLMVQMGCGPIALVGQDLAFTSGQSHAEGTHGVRNVNPETALLQVEDFFKTSTVSTSRNLYYYLRWFERYVRERQEPERFWNCTEGGAYINGWVHAKLNMFYANFG